MGRTSRSGKVYDEWSNDSYGRLAKAPGTNNKTQNKRTKDRRTTRALDCMRPRPHRFQYRRSYCHRSHASHQTFPHKVTAHSLHSAWSQSRQHLPLSLFLFPMCRLGLLAENQRLWSKTARLQTQRMYCWPHQPCITNNLEDWGVGRSLRRDP